MKVVVISGNIGCGKSTTLDKLRKTTAECVLEPIEEWQAWLVKMYNGGPEELLFFQMLVYAHYVRLTAQLDKLRDEKSDKTVYVERSPFDAIWTFLPVNQHRLDFSALHQNYMDLARHPVWKEATYIYLHCDPEVCIERIKRRDRVGEDKIGVAFIREMDAWAKRWIGEDERVQTDRHLNDLTETPLMVVDTTYRTPTEVQEMIEANV